MFRVVTIHDILDGTFNEDSFVVEEAFFFTIKSSPYYVIYNKMAEIIGMVPSDYNLFFKVDHHGGFEDIDMEKLIRKRNDYMHSRKLISVNSQEIVSWFAKLLKMIEIIENPPSIRKYEEDCLINLKDKFNN